MTPLLPLMLCNFYYESLGDLRHYRPLHYWHRSMCHFAEADCTSLRQLASVQVLVRAEGGRLRAEGGVLFCVDVVSSHPRAFPLLDSASSH